MYIYVLMDSILRSYNTDVALQSLISVVYVKIREWHFREQKIKTLLKAKLNEHILTILLLKQDIGQVYATVDFIRIGWFELWDTWKKRKLQNEKFLPTAGLEPTISRLLYLRTNRLLWGRSDCRHFKVNYIDITIDIRRGGQIR